MKSIRVGLAFLVFAIIVGIPFWYRAKVTTNYRNFRVVESGQMYRSGRLSIGALDCVCREYGIRTVINLRETSAKDGKEGAVFDDEDEQRFCEQNKIAFHRLPKYQGWSPNGNGENEGEASLKRFFEILNDPKTEYPVLVHCFAGIHRTGAHVAAYRMEFQGWSAGQALAEMQSMGTVRTTFSNDLINFLGNYTPRGMKR